MECKLSKLYCFAVGGNSFNRNIMECKLKTNCTLNHIATVLIETLWNVNKKSVAEKRQQLTVLIETLWNVNTEPSSV